MAITVNSHHRRHPVSGKSGEGHERLENVIVKKEHRCCARSTLDREIMIGYPQTGFVRAHVRDISLGGMYIETTALLTLNRPVELIFRVSANGAPRTHRWRATVRHIATDGAGLKYEPFVLTELPALLRLLRAAERQDLERNDERIGLRLDRDRGHASPAPTPSSGLRQDNQTPEHDQ
jgi:hypothetical protein